MVKVFIKGTPYSQNKRRGKVEAPKEWSEAIVEATAELPKIKFPCSLSAEFVLPGDKYPKDFPQGPDLDNLLKRLLDALQKTVLQDDSLVIQLEASKRQARTGEPAGVYISFDRRS